MKLALLIQTDCQQGCMTLAHSMILVSEEPGIELAMGGQFRLILPHWGSCRKLGALMKPSFNTVTRDAKLHARGSLD